MNKANGTFKNESLIQKDKLNSFQIVSIFNEIKRNISFKPCFFVDCIFISHTFIFRDKWVSYKLGPARWLLA